MRRTKKENENANANRVHLGKRIKGHHRRKCVTVALRAKSFGCVVCVVWFVALRPFSLFACRSTCKYKRDFLDAAHQFGRIVEIKMVKAHRTTENLQTKIHLGIPRICCSRSMWRSVECTIFGTHILHANAGELLSPANKSNMASLKQ